MLGLGEGGCNLMHKREILKSTVAVVQCRSHARLSVTPWTAAHQAFLSFTIFRNLLKLMPVKSGMPSRHPIFCRPLVFLPSIFPSIRVFSNESSLRVRWPKYWSFSFSISLSDEYSGLISFKTDALVSFEINA